MKQYVISILIVGVIGSIVNLLTPSGERGSISSHVRLATGLVLILVCVSPLLTVVRGLGELDISDILGGASEIEKEEYQSIFDESYSAAEIENVKAGIKSILWDKFGIAEDECYVSVTTESGEDGKRSIKRIFINLYGRAILKNTDEIESYLASLFGCEIVTAVG